MSLNPEEPMEEPHVRQARELLQQKQPAEAAVAIRRHLNYAHGTSLDYLLLGVALAQSGDDEHAMAALEQAEKMDTHDATIPYNLGLVYRKEGRSEDAAAAFERALALRPGYDAARRALGALGQSPASASIPAGPVRCAHCGMETRVGADCEWCSHPLGHATHPHRAPHPPAVASAVPPEPGGGLLGRLARKLHRH